MPKRKEYTRRDRNAARVVSQREQKIHLDSTKHRLREIDCRDDIFKIASHIPVIGGIFEACKNVLDEVKAVKDQADDVAEAAPAFSETIPAIAAES